MTDFQVAVIGGGPAGLAATLTLSRSLIRTILLDDSKPARNAASPDISAFPGLDRIPPTEFREVAAREISEYGYAVREPVAANSVVKTSDNHFEIVTSDGKSFTARFVLLATGMIDLFPEIDGLDKRWGRSVINCPFCQGYEWKNRAWGILAHRPEILAAVEIYRNWTEDLTLFVAPETIWPVGRRRALETMGVRIVDDGVASLHGDGEALSQIITNSGETIDREVLLIWPRQRQCDLVTTMALPLDEDGSVRVDGQFETDMPGIYAAGDLTYSGHQNVNTSIHMGNMAAANLVFELCMAG
ncbi:MAG: NAD(P)/FAD-dependent oxidoreductase [Stappiaceae bacterium]